jgi:hypothetical protein
MEHSQITHIKYTRVTDLGGGSVGDITERYIIPTSVPYSTIKAIDVSDLTEEQREDVQALWTQYREYYENALASLFDFETWAEHSAGKTIDVKWRTFRTDNVEILD